jgi:hypothetical protein
LADGGKCGAWSQWYVGCWRFFTYPCNSNENNLHKHAIIYTYIYIYCKYISYIYNTYNVFI